LYYDALHAVTNVTVADQSQCLVATHDVYVDDFVSMAQYNSKRRHQVKRSLYKSLDSVFWSLHDTSNPHHQEPVIIKKMLKGDSTWATYKLILGWILGTVNKTIQFLVR
jgi:hypothetical protein